MKVVISGGGTGGHIFPAIAIADKIKHIHPEASILFVGAEGKMEMERVPKAGYEIIGLPIRGLQRSLTRKNLSFPIRLIKSLRKARRIVRDFKPDVAIGVGGYASGPLLWAAERSGVPTLLQEQNSYAGLTNKLLAKKASTICVAYPDMGRFFPSDKIVRTGNPVRQVIIDNDINTLEAKATLGVDRNKKTILVFGGSLGARSLNDAVRAHLDLLREKGYNVIWQVGKLYYPEFERSEIMKMSNVKILPFIEDMNMAYAAAEVVVCRAGALTISELSLKNKAAILVPSPNVSEDHQTKNAMALVNEDAAVLVADASVKEELGSAIVALMEDDEKRSSLETNIERFARPEATLHIAQEVLKLIKK